VSHMFLMFLAVIASLFAGAFAISNRIYRYLEETDEYGED
jgi:hypothetical protein